MNTYTLSSWQFFSLGRAGFGPCNVAPPPLQLQLSAEEAQSQVLQMEQALGALQTERDEAQRAAALLQSCVDQLTQVKTPQRSRLHYTRDSSDVNSHQGNVNVLISGEAG